MAVMAKLRQRVGRWIRRRQGPDAQSVTLRKGRIYILPTRLGLAYAATLLAMLLGSLNYANNLGLALTFLLTSLGLVAMQACHRNLEGLVLQWAGTEPAHAGQAAGFRLMLASPGHGQRWDLEPGQDAGRLTSIPGEGHENIVIALPTRRRGHVRLERLEIATRYPFGLFRAWSVLHPEISCLVYPRAAAQAPACPPAPGPASQGVRVRGEDDFAGLREYHPGDSPRHIAWKALARGGELLVKEFASAAQQAPVFDFEQAPGADAEQRLSILCRWIVDADARGDSYALRLPGREIEPGHGAQHRQACLAALAEHGHPEPDRG